MKTIKLKKLRELTLRKPIAPGRPAYLSAASGLVIIGSIAYVVADDEQHLGIFSLKNKALGTVLRLFPGELPVKKKPRKKQKADLEALVRLPPFSSFKNGALLAIGSGSTKKRRRGVLLPLDARGRVTTKLKQIDLTNWFKPIAAKVGELNIEGAFVACDRLNLLQRGNKGAGINAIVAIPLQYALDSLIDDKPRSLPFTIHRYKLGAIDKIPLGFTDGSALPNGRIAFSAVAEDSENAYEDGACAGAAVGVLTKRMRLKTIGRLSPSAKVEGIHATANGHSIRLHLVTDADDVNIPASLYVVDLKG